MVTATLLLQPEPQRGSADETPPTSQSFTLAVIFSGALRDQGNQGGGSQLAGLRVLQAMCSINALEHILQPGACFGKTVGTTSVCSLLAAVGC